ncbi:MULTISPECIES: hypothetical protein [Deinococcus]|uniref:CopG family transcriptional regulator n=1 Tax=Deinococcus aquaticus TaxID=328692 RepID=A0ABY7V666_9DEIO|nr:MULTISPECIES: hypothetical protein [Deinococcus]OOV11905.1 hypothetical protein BXU09_19325 [Deinococcus sp. LM3]WDA60610.1 hypothetical protein M8445_17890 [Deinococcus aquaticus]
MSKFGGALKKLQAVQQEDSAGKPENPNTGKPEAVTAAGAPAEAPKRTGKPENLKSGELPVAGIEREKYSTYLDSELVTALKLHAVRHKMKHHHVVEAALRAYLKDQE